MVSGSEIALMSRAGELARRFGLRPSEVEPETGWVNVGHNGDFGFFLLKFTDCTNTVTGHQKFGRMMTALGCNAEHELRNEDMSALEDGVELAFSRAPRSRSR